MNRVTEFMLSLTKRLMEERGVSEPTANLYVRTMWALNGKQPFKSLVFLKDIPKVEASLTEYADATKKTILASIVSVLSLMEKARGYKKVYEHYLKAMNEMIAEANGKDTAEKSEKQTENWISWEEIQSIKSALKEKVDSLPAKGITAKQYGDLLSYVVLSLYTDIPPRRNLDYMECYVVGKWDESKPSDVNYYDVAMKRFIFNKYKTAKSHGRQIVEVGETPLAGVIETYLKHHPLSKGRITKGTMFRFLVGADGTPMTAVNSITRILNRVIGKKVGSSMLRHIYLSSKYDIAEMKADAEAMGHTINEQKKYLKEE